MLIYILRVVFWCLTLSIGYCYTSNNNYESYKLTYPMQIQVMQHYNKKYNANIIISDNFVNMIKTFKKRQGTDDTRIMWHTGAKSGHATPIFYLKENGHEALFIADSIMNYVDDATSLYQKISIPIFTIEDMRQNDSYSCFLDSLLWGKMVTGKLPDGSYRIPNIVHFLYQHSYKRPIKSNMPIYIVEKLPTTLLATAQNKNFIAQFKLPNDDTFITSHGEKKSFSTFLQTHQGTLFALDYLRTKGLQVKEKYGLGALPMLQSPLLINDDDDMAVDTRGNVNILDKETKKWMQSSFNTNELQAFKKFELLSLPMFQSPMLQY